MTFGPSPGQGARDGDPIAFLILLFMGFILLLWLSNASFSPWQGNFGCSGNPQPNCHTVIAGGFNNAFNTLNTSGFMTLFIPLAMVMFIFYIYRGFGGEDVEELYKRKVLRQSSRNNEEEDRQEDTEN